MKITAGGRASLKRRLLATLLIPLCSILLGLGLYGAWFVKRVVEAESDRVLSGSLQAISETLAVDGGYLTLDLPPSALGMLENADRDNVYYSVTYQGRLVTGYPELKITDHAPALGSIEFRDGAFRGMPIRIATEARLVPQLRDPVIVQVAETVKNRTAIADRMLTALAAVEIALLLVISGLIFWGIDRGLVPLGLLQRDITNRLSRPELDFGPLSTSGVPREMLPFVSAFNLLLGQVEAAINTLRRFTSDASHQIRAPLAVVRTHVELLKRNQEGQTGAQEAIADIHTGVLALQHLTAQLLALAKAERPSEESDIAGQFDLVACADAVARTYAAKALMQNMELSFERAVAQSLICGNALLAGEMISNLLDNAIRYGKCGGHILVRVGMEPGVLEIEDDGPGIPVQERERVFERFYRLPGNMDREGSGLGLSIVQVLGRRMGAMVNLENAAAGSGLKVVVAFKPVPSGSPQVVPTPQEFGPNKTIHVGEQAGADSYDVVAS